MRAWAATRPAVPSWSYTAARNNGWRNANRPVPRSSAIAAATASSSRPSVVATSWSAAAASVATAKSPPMAEARPSTARQAPGRRVTRSAIVAVIAGGTGSSASRSGRPSRRRTVSVTNSGLPRVRSTSASTSALASSAAPISPASAATSARASGSSTTSLPSLRSSTRAAPSGDEGGASSGR